MAIEAGVDRAWELLKSQVLSGKGGHSALLDLSSRMAGFQHWHEAHARSPIASSPRFRGDGGFGDTGHKRVLVEISNSGARLGAAGGLGLSVDFSTMLVESPKLASDALAAIVLSLPPPPSWSPQAWIARARGFAAMLPEARQRMASLGEQSTISFLASWDGISRARTLFDKSERGGLGARWIDWARPWHSTVAATDSDAQMSYAPMAAAWALAESLAARADTGPEDWLATARQGSLAVDAGDHGAWLALAKILLRSQGLSGEISNPDALSPDLARLAMIHFPPA